MRKISVSDELLGGLMLSGGLAVSALLILFGHGLLSSRLLPSIDASAVAECAYCTYRLAPILPQVLLASAVIGGFMILRLWRMGSS